MTKEVEQGLGPGGLLKVEEEYKSTTIEESPC